MQATVDAARAMTFQACADAYIAAHKSGWRSPKSLTAWEGTLGAYVHPVFGALPVQAIDTALVTKAIEPIWAEKPETAGRVRGRIEAILDWAAARGHRQGDNPARWRGHLDKLLPNKTKVRRVAHHAALPFPEIGAFMAELRQEEGVAARALEFAILTAARTGEVIGARWDEFNLAERLWTIPSERMKAGRERRVPLSDAALAIVEQLAGIRASAAVGIGRLPGRMRALGVVDPELRVRGIDGLRVADASVMPTVVAGNTNAATIMIGERAADLVREAARLAA